ncbi:ATP-dependent Clp protease proteolytic subunit, partial [Holdemania massiliensis]
MTLIPTIIEQSARSERAYDLISCLLKERIILLTAPIDDTVSGNLCAQLLYLASRSGQDIQLYINSPGGSVSASEVIRAELAAARAAGKPVVVSMGGMAASGGYWIST